MKVVIPTIGSRGDVQPFIALAQGLIHAGHSVTILSHPVMRELVESFGGRVYPHRSGRRHGRGLGFRPRALE